MEEQEKANIESATEIQKFMRAYNSKQGTQKMILEKQTRKEIQGEQERKKTQEEKTINSLILKYENSNEVKTAYCLIKNQIERFEIIKKEDEGRKNLNKEWRKN